MANVVFVTRGTGGDLVPILRMCSVLKARGHCVLLISHCKYESIACSLGLNFRALDNMDEFNRFIQDGHLLNSASGIQTFFRSHMLPKSSSDHEIIASECQPDDTILIARHMSSFAEFTAEKLQIPFVRVYIAAAHISALPILASLYGNVLENELNAIRMELNLPLIHNWLAWLHSPQNSIATWPNWFAAPERGWPSGVVTTGFINHDESETGCLPSDVISLLKAPQRPVLISGGTGIFMGKKFYTAAAKACQLLGLPGLIVTPYKELVPKNIPDNIQWHSRLPFSSLIPHVCAIIHHAGTSTLARAIASGIPQLVLPYGGDRPDTGHRLEKLGVAKMLLPPQWQPEEVAEALELLLRSAAVKDRCKALALRHNDEESVSIACSVIEQALATSSNRPIANSNTTVEHSDSFPTAVEYHHNIANADARIQALSPLKRAYLTLRVNERRNQTKICKERIG